MSIEIGKELRQYLIERASLHKSVVKPCANIKRKYTNFRKYVDNHLDALVGIKLKTVLPFAGVCVDQIVDWVTLVRNERYSSMDASLRNILESYATFYYLFECYTDDILFEERSLVLYILDLEQNIKILRDTEKWCKNLEVKKQKTDALVKHIKNRIVQTFPKQQFEHDGTIVGILAASKAVLDTEKTLHKTQIDIIEGRRPKYVAKALEANDSWTKSQGKQFDDGRAFYRSLCRYTHNNVTSIIQRMFHNGIFVFNEAPYMENFRYLYGTVLCCMNDVTTKVKSIFK
jgi:hypothetical protein